MVWTQWSYHHNRTIWIEKIIVLCDSQQESIVHRIIAQESLLRRCYQPHLNPPICRSFAGKGLIVAAPSRNGEVFANDSGEERRSTQTRGSSAKLCCAVCMIRKLIPSLWLAVWYLLQPQYAACKAVRRPRVDFVRLKPFLQARIQSLE